MIVDRTPEKVALAKELGLHSWAKIHGMMNMKFKPLNRRDARRRLNDGKIMWRKELLIFDAFQSLTIGGAAFTLSAVLLAVTASSSPHLSPKWLLLSPVAGALGVVFMYLRSGICEVSVERMSLEMWNDNIPYGGLLAVKEAKDIGMSNFQIYYPTIVSRRLMSDPIITGMINDVEYEVFYWDDGTIYE